MIRNSSAYIQYVYMQFDQSLIREMYFYANHELGVVPGTRDITVSEITRVSSLKYTVFFGVDHIK